MRGPRAPAPRVLGWGPRGTRLSQVRAQPLLLLGRRVEAPFSHRWQLAHPGHIDFLIIADRFIGSKRIAHFGNVSIVGLIVGAREGAQDPGAHEGRGMWETGGVQRPNATRHWNLVYVRKGPLATGPPALRSRVIPRPPRGLSSLWRRGGRSSASSPYTLSRPGKSSRVSDSFVKRLSPVPGPDRVEACQTLGRSGLPRWPSNAAASAPLGRQRLFCARPLRPPPFPGQSSGPASCCLIFSTIPFARLYLTRYTSLRRSLGHQILYIAAWARPPRLGADWKAPA